MKLRLSDDLLRFRLDEREVSALADGQTLAFTVAGLTVRLVVGSPVGITTDADYISVVIPPTDIAPANREEPQVYEGQINGTSVLVELDLRSG